MKELTLETRIAQKNRLCWVLVFFWVIVIGILFYALYTWMDLTGAFIITILLTLVYTTIGELATKTIRIFWWRGVLVFPLASVVVHILDNFSPSLTSGAVDPNWFYSAILLYVLLFMFWFFGVSAGTLITRLVRGYEAFSKEPVVVSYSMKGETEDITALLEGFLKSLNIEFNTIVRRAQKNMNFYNGSNEYFLFPQPVNNDSVEVNFVALRWKRETIIEPNNEDLSIFLVYFESFLNKQKEEGKLVEWTSDFKPKYAKSRKIGVWKDYTSPLQIREKLALRGLISQRLIAVIRTHKKGIITFILGVFTVVIGELLIRYVIQL